LHLIESKQVIGITIIVGKRKKKRPQNENRASMLLKTHIEKMSTLDLSMMLMKTKELQASHHDVDDNKGC
jgi:hypothetical protein